VAEGRSQFEGKDKGKDKKVNGAIILKCEGTMGKSA
jgi:hypothetical protein